MRRPHKLKSYKTKNEIVYDFLKSNILNGKIKLGEKITIRDIAKKLNVSDIPVREAIKKLEMQGLVNVIPHIGASVVKIDKRQIQEIFLIRSELESLATRLASKYIKKNDLNKLSEIIEEYEKAIQSGKVEKYGELNKKFHLYIYKCSPYKLLVKIISDLWASCSMARIVFVLSDKRLRQSQKEHRLILEALTKGKGDLAGELVRRQKIESWNVISRTVKET